MSLEQEMVGITIDTQLCERTKHDLEVFDWRKIEYLILSDAQGHRKSIKEKTNCDVQKGW